MTAATGAYQGATVLAVVLTAVTGFLIYRLNARQRIAEEQLSKTDRTADLARTEVEGWKTLLEAMNEQYRDAAKEVAQLREKLAAAYARLEVLVVELRSANDEIGRCAEKVNRLEDRLLSRRIDELDQRTSHRADAQDVRSQAIEDKADVSEARADGVADEIVHTEHRNDETPGHA